MTPLRVAGTVCPGCTVMDSSSHTLAQSPCRLVHVICPVDSALRLAWTRIASPIDACATPWTSTLASLISADASEGGVAVSWSSLAASSLSDAIRASVSVRKPAFTPDSTSNAAILPVSRPAVPPAPAATASTSEDAGYTPSTRSTICSLITTPFLINRSISNSPSRPCAPCRHPAT